LVRIRHAPRSTSKVVVFTRRVILLVRVVFVLAFVFVIIVVVIVVIVIVVIIFVFSFAVVDSVAHGAVTMEVDCTDSEEDNIS
jgi:uncharacterized membrane protein